MLEYGWEVMDAFLDDMKKEDPDLLILSGDLTLDGEKASHEELAELLEGLSEAGMRSRLYRETTISITRMPALYGGWSGKGGVHHSGRVQGYLC